MRRGTPGTSTLNNGMDRREPAYDDDKSNVGHTLHQIEQHFPKTDSPCRAIPVMSPKPYKVGRFRYGFIRNIAEFHPKRWKITVFSEFYAYFDDFGRSLWFKFHYLNTPDSSVYIPPRMKRKNNYVLLSEISCQSTKIWIFWSGFDQHIDHFWPQISTQLATHVSRLAKFSRLGSEPLTKSGPHKCLTAHKICEKVGAEIGPTGNNGIQYLWHSCNLSESRCQQPLV